MPNQQKVDEVQVITDKLKSAQSVAIVEYAGTSVNDLTKLRSELKASGGEFYVTKNTLIDIALGRGRVKDSLKGMNALVFSNQDPVSAIKALFKFHDDSDKLSIKQGLMVEEDTVLSPDQVKDLSEMPSFNELIAKMLGSLKAPANGLRNVITAGPQNLVYALKAVSEKKAE